MNYSITPIGILESCFKEKFGIPKQAGLIKESRGIIKLIPPFNLKETVKELELFSHLWIFFIFHKAPKESWTPTVRPPRLGGNKRVGVFASRSPVRPNFIGQSLVKLEKIVLKKDQVNLHISGIDMLDGTPIIDIKPYLPYNDIVKNASWGWIDKSRHLSREKIKVSFSKEALSYLKNKKDFSHIKKLIKEIIQNDPRPGYYDHNPKESRKKNFAQKLYDFDVHWEISDKGAIVTQIFSERL